MLAFVWALFFYFLIRKNCSIKKDLFIEKVGFCSFFIEKVGINL